MRVLPPAVLVVVAMLAWAATAGATPSTIISIPSTDTFPKGTFFLDYDTLFTTGQAHNTTAMDFGLGYGITDRWEIGVDYLTNTGHPLTFNTKYRVYDHSGFAVAVGAWMLGDSGSTGGNQYYGLASYKSSAGRFAVGGGIGDQATFGPDHNQLWASWDKQLAKKWWAGVDYISGQSFAGSTNLGVAYTFADNTSIIFGYDFYNNSAFPDTVTVQLDLGFK